KTSTTCTESTTTESPLPRCSCHHVRLRRIDPVDLAVALPNRVRLHRKRCPQPSRRRTRTRTRARKSANPLHQRLLPSQSTPRSHQSQRMTPVLQLSCRKPSRSHTHTRARNICLRVFSPLCSCVFPASRSLMLIVDCLFQTVNKFLTPKQPKQTHV